MLSSEAAKAPAETKAKKSMKVQESASSLATIESAAGSVASSLPNRKPNIPIKASRDQFWPQETQQEGKMRLHCARLKEWLPLFDQLADYATVYAHFHEAINKESLKLGTAFRVHQDHLLGSPEVLQKMRDMVNSIGKEHGTWAKEINAKTVKGLKTMKADCYKEYKNFKNQANKLLEDLHKERTETLTKLAHHINTFEMVRVKKSSDVNFEDPWLTEKAVREQIKKVTAKENDIQQALLKLQNDIMNFEASLMQSLKNELASVIQSMQQHHGRLQATFLGIQGFAVQIENSSAYRSYAQKHGIFNDPVYTTKRTMEDFPWPYEIESENSSVEKEGILLRQGTFKKSNFHESFYVLTKNGFLHCFEFKSSKQTSEEAKSHPNQIKYSIYLQKPKVIVAKSDINMNCFDIIVPGGKGGLFGSSTATYTIKAKSEKEMDEWMEVMGAFLTCNREPPTVSTVERRESIGTVTDDIPAVPEAAQTDA